MELFALICRDCDYRQEYTPEQVVSLMRPFGLFRRSDPKDLGSSSAVLGIARGGLSKMACPGCKEHSLHLTRVEEPAEEEWEVSRPCTDCGKPIESERLEALPNSQTCMACSRKSQAVMDEYCPRCGDRMVVRGGRSPGISRYALYCNTCRK